MSKKMLFFFLTIALLVSANSISLASAGETRIGDVVNQVLYTDIVTYIDGQEIASYNIDGYTVVCAEDLRQYGFSVYWNEFHRYLVIGRHDDASAKPNYKSAAADKSRIGVPIKPVLYTNIAVYAGDSSIMSYNIGGYTCVYVDDLAKFYGSGYVYDDISRTLTLNLKPAPILQENINAILTRNSDFLTNYLDARYDSSYGTILYGSTGGTPHGNYAWLLLVKDDGFIMNMLIFLPNDGGFGIVSDYDISDMAMSGDGTHLLFTRYYKEQYYRYNLDLPSATLALEP
ncbi:MAG: hypothetical protein LBT44_00875 [Clostridiales bacterium]|jgi:hypothetical protein|nr:hypothetical protein [Clostridiales bacterium]